MALGLEQWLGLWLIVAAAVLNTAAACLVLGGLAVVNRMDGRRGGRRGEGCRPDAGVDGPCSSAEGSAGGRLFAAEWPLGVIQLEEARRSRT